LPLSAARVGAVVEAQAGDRAAVQQRQRDHRGDGLAGVVDVQLGLAWVVPYLASVALRVSA